MFYFNNSLLSKRIINDSRVVVFKTNNNYSMQLRLIEKKEDKIITIGFFFLEENKIHNLKELTFPINSKDININIKQTLFYIMGEIIRVLKEKYKYNQSNIDYLYLLHFESYYKSHSSNIFEDVFVLCAANYISMLSKYKGKTTDIHLSYFKKESNAIQHLYSERFFETYSIEFTKEGFISFLIKEKLNLFGQDFLLTYLND